MLPKRSMQSIQCRKSTLPRERPSVANAVTSEDCNYQVDFDQGPATVSAVMASDAVSGMIVAMFPEKSKISCRFEGLGGH